MIAGADARVTKVAGSRRCFCLLQPALHSGAGREWTPSSARIWYIGPASDGGVAVTTLAPDGSGSAIGTCATRQGGQGTRVRKNSWGERRPRQQQTKKRGDEDFEVMLQGILPSFLSAFWTQMNSAKVTALLQ